jgi:hypothetical protein
MKKLVSRLFQARPVQATSGMIGPLIFESPDALLAHASEFRDCHLHIGAAFPAIVQGHGEEAGAAVQTASGCQILRITIPVRAGRASAVGVAATPNTGLDVGDLVEWIFTSMTAVRLSGIIIGTLAPEIHGHGYKVLDRFR